MNRVHTRSDTSPSSAVLACGVAVKGQFRFIMLADLLSKDVFHFGCAYTVQSNQHFTAWPGLGCLLPAADKVRCGQRDSHTHTACQGDRPDGCSTFLCLSIVFVTIIPGLTSASVTYRTPPFPTSSSHPHHFILANVQSDDLPRSRHNLCAPAFDHSCSIYRPI